MSLFWPDVNTSQCIHCYLWVREAPAANPDLVNRLIVSTRPVLLPQGEVGEILYSCIDRQRDRQRLRV